MRLPSHIVVTLCSVLFALVTSSARAVDGDDGLYERFDGDVWMSLMVGGGARLDDGGAAPAGLVEVRSRYLDTAGFFVTGEYADHGFGVALGIDLRPFFLARFLTARTLSRRFWDLLLDSVGLDMGMRLRGEGDLNVAFVVGSGADVPLYANESFRMAVRLAFRYAHLADFEARTRDSDWTLSGGLVFETRVASGVVSLRETR